MPISMKACKFTFPPVYIPKYASIITSNNHTHVSDNNTQLILCSVFLAMSLHLHQNDLRGSESTSNHLSCTHICICTHITMIIKYSFHNTNIYVWLRICMRKSFSSILLSEGGGGVCGWHIAQVHRCTTHFIFMKLIIIKVLCINFNFVNFSKVPCH